MRTVDSVIALLIGEINERQASILRTIANPANLGGPGSHTEAMNQDIVRLTAACNALMEPREAVMRVRAHVIALDNWQTNVCFTQIYKDEIAKLYRGSEYSHVDVYSPAEAGETLLYRVKL